MKERYPFLIYWMKIGINKFPTLAGDPMVLERFLVEQIERYPEVYKEPALKKYRESEDPVFKDLRKFGNTNLNTFLQWPPEQEVWETMIRPAIIYHVIQKHIQNVMKQYTDSIRKIKYQGQTTNDIAETLARSLLSNYHGRGSRIFKSVGDCQIIKTMYREMCNAITEIRRTVKVPCRLRERVSWSLYVNEYEQISESIPDYKEIFDNKELPLLTELSSVTDCAIAILHRRLRRFLPPRTSKITLKDQLQRGRRLRRK